VVASDADVAAAYDCEVVTSLLVLGWSSSNDTLELPNLTTVEEDLLICEGDSTQPRLVPPGLNIQGGCSRYSPETISLPSLEVVGGSLVIINTHNLSSVQFDSLQSIDADVYELQGQGFSMVGNTNLSMLSMPQLSDIGSDGNCSRIFCAGVNVARNPELTALDLPALTSLPTQGPEGSLLGPYVLVAGHRSLDTISLPSLEAAWTISIGSNIQGGPNAALTSLNLTSLVSIRNLTVEQSPDLADIVAPACESFETLTRPTYKMVCVPADESEPDATVAG